MYTLDLLIDAFMILISSGAVVRTAMYLIEMIFNLDDKVIYIKKIKNSIIAVVVSSSIFTLKAIIEHYFYK